MSNRVLIVLLFVAFDVLALVFVFDHVHVSSSSSEIASQRASGVAATPSETHAATQAARDRSGDPALPAVHSRRSAVATAANSDSAHVIDATLVVRCVAQSTRAPLEAVRVALTARDLALATNPVAVDRASGILGESPITDASGEVRVGVPSGLELELETSSVRKEIGAAALVVDGLDPDERRTVVVELPFGDDVHVCGLVLDADGKRPIAGASVTAMTIDQDAADAAADSASNTAAGPAPSSAVPSDAHDSSAPPRPATRASSEHACAATTTDAQGRFELSIASWRDPYVRVAAAGFGVALADLASGHETPEHALVVLLNRSASIEARIVDEVGEPIRDVEVSAYVEAYRLQVDAGATSSALIGAPNVEWSAITNARGTCAVRDVVSGIPLKIHFARNGERLREDAEIASLAPGEVRSAQWDIGLGCSLAATLLDEDGLAVGHREVWLFAAASDATRAWRHFSRETLIATRTTDDSGKVTFHVGAGTWCLGPTPQRASYSSSDEREIVPRGELVEIGLGVRRQEIALHARHGSYIRGRVIDSTGHAPNRFSVTLIPREPTEQYFMRSSYNASGIYASTGPNATFVAGPFLSDEFELTATGYDAFRDTPSAKVRARSGDHDVVLQLKRAGSVAGRVFDARTHEPVQASLRISPVSRWSTTSNVDGTFAVPGVWPGSYSLIATTRDGRIGVLPRIDVAESGTQGLEIDVRPGGHLRLRYEGSRAECLVTVSASNVWLEDASLKRLEGWEVLAPVGTVAIAYQAKGDDFYLRDREVTVEAGQTTQVTIGDE